MNQIKFHVTLNRVKIIPFSIKNLENWNYNLKLHSFI